MPLSINLSNPSHNIRDLDPKEASRLTWCEVGASDDLFDAWWVDVTEKRKISFDNLRALLGCVWKEAGVAANVPGSDERFLRWWDSLSGQDTHDVHYPPPPPDARSASS